MGSFVRCCVRRDTYRDSVQLMRIAADLERLPDIRRVAMLMGTPANRALLATAGLLHTDAEQAKPTDLVLAVEAVRADAAEAALAEAQRRLSAHEATPVSCGAAPAPATIHDALAAVPDANLAIISTPGPFAGAEALKALKRGLHVFLFSDNVPIEQEVELKRVARRKGLLMMGPDCGTAILDGVPLGFANAVRRGRIGLIGASGTGLQQVSCLVHNLGEGISQAIGVGGRDLQDGVGGTMMIAAMERLAADPGTEIVGLISKPPSADVARRVLEAAEAMGKPVVVHFPGADPSTISRRSVFATATLEDAACKCVALARGCEPEGSGPAPGGRAAGRAHRFLPGQSVVYGLYSGGTLGQEAALVLDAASAKHTVVDLGADEYTIGRPHPMIDVRLRNERIVQAAQEPSTAVILFDVVLGHGAHPDPAGALAPALIEGRRRAAASDRDLAFVASVCGTADDPQSLPDQERRLEQAGALLAPSNAAAARLAAALVKESKS